MLKFVKIQSLYTPFKPIKPLQTLTPNRIINGFHRFTSSIIDENNVGIFWDLDNKPPKSHPPYDAAIRLRKAAEQFGFVKYKFAYANRHSFNYIPPEIKEKRKVRRAVNELENRGVINPVKPYTCKVCGRRFYNNDKFINHFKQIHEEEHKKRMNQIESARGSLRVKLIGKYSMKMEKYKYAAKDVLIPSTGYGLGDELKRAGFWVKVVSDKAEAADIELRSHLVEMMDKRRISCVVIVSDDSDFVEVLKEARLRCLKIVVVGDDNDGKLKRVADASFSWKEIMMGKARKEGLSIVGKWRDRDILKRLEWSYNPEVDKKRYYSEIESNDDVEGFLSGEDGDDDESLAPKEDSRAWWELKSDVADSIK